MRLKKKTIIMNANGVYIVQISASVTVKKGQ